MVYYLSRLVGSPVALSFYRTSKVYKVYYLVARRLTSRVECYRMSKVYKVYYLVARRLGGSPVALSVDRTSKVYKVYYLVARRLVGSSVALSVYRTSKPIASRVECL